MKKMLVFLLLFAVGVVFAGQYDKWDETVKVLISKEEKDAFKKLKTDAEKEKFVADFWAKRDPSPGTPDNEFKKAYEDRLKTVNDNIKGGPKKPIDTDMGKAILLLGNPTEEKKDEAGEVPKRTWIWKGLPKEMAVGDLEITFEGDPEEGGFVFSEPKAANESLDKVRSYLASLQSLAKAPTQAPAPTAPPKVAAPAGGPLTTPALKTALDSAAAGTPPKDLPMESVSDSFMTSEGETFVAVAVKSSDPAAATSKVGVRVVDASGATVKETELPFASAEEKPGYSQTSIAIPPGEYSVLTAVSNGSKAGAAKKPISVPDYKSKLSLSSLVLVGEFQNLKEAKPEMVPYTFVNSKIQPSFDGVFPKTAELRVMYEIYNPPADGTASLEESIIFQRVGGPGKKSSPGTPKGFVVGKKIIVPVGFPLTSFEPGEYKLVLTITDKTSGQKAERDVTFKVQ